MRIFRLSHEQTSWRLLGLPPWLPSACLFTAAHQRRPAWPAPTPDAAMLEAAGLLEDALREYSELEACYLEALQVGGWVGGMYFCNILGLRFDSGPV